MTVLSTISMRGDLSPDLLTREFARIQDEPVAPAPSGELVVADKRLEGELVDGLALDSGWADPDQQLLERLLRGLQKL